MSASCGCNREIADVASNLSCFLLLQSSSAREKLLFAPIPRLPACQRCCWPGIRGFFETNAVLGLCRVCGRQPTSFFLVWSSVMINCNGLKPANVALQRPVAQGEIGFACKPWAKQSLPNNQTAATANCELYSKGTCKAGGLSVSI